MAQVSWAVSACGTRQNREGTHSTAADRVGAESKADRSGRGRISVALKEGAGTICSSSAKKFALPLSLPALHKAAAGLSDLIPLN